LVSEVLAVSLKGSLETFALPEVLNLLADTSKSGELCVRGSRVDGRMWFDSGAFSAFAVGDSEKPFEAIFELLRDTGGDFEFLHGEVAPESATQADYDHRDVRVEIDRAQARLAEWVDIVAVVPSLGHDVKLASVAPSDHVTVDRAQWELIVAVGNGGAVQDVLRSCQLREFEGCRAIKGLVDISLAQVSEASAPAVAVEPEPAYVEDYPQEVVADYAPAEPQVEDYEQPAPVAGPADVEDVTPEAADDSSEVGEPVNPHYSDLWAAALEATQTENGVEPAPVAVTDSEVTVPVEVSQNGHEEHAPEPHEQDGREALRALLAEVTSTVDETPTTVSDEPVDGLKDRGPWTSNELASFENWTEDESQPAEETAAVTAHDASPQPGEELAEHQVQVEAEPVAEEAVEEPVEEPINRGLLLKFLSSVRN
jgi:hypothetical protein